MVFAVPQISVKLDEITDEHRQALAFWLGFMREHRDLLLDAPLEVAAPHNLYPLVRAQKDDRAVIALYDGGRIADLPDDAREIFLLNATPEARAALCCAAPRRFHATLTDCRGRLAGERDIDVNGLALLPVPVSGMARLTEL